MGRRGKVSEQTFPEAFTDGQERKPMGPTGPGLA